MDRFAMQVLVLAEQQRHEVDRLEQDEDDPERLKRLYEVDHALTMIRRTARELRVLVDSDESETGGDATSLLDVVRMAASSIESYSRVRIASVAELAVPSYAADDVASMVAPLLDNAARYSPGTVDVGVHPTESGGVIVRISDSGIGLGEAHVRALNATMSGGVPPLDSHAARHTGFPVVHRLAHRHGASVTFSSRPASDSARPSGTTAVLSLPAHLVCDPPASAPAVGEMAGEGRPQAERPAPAAADAAARPPHLSLAPGPIGPDSAPPPEPAPPQRPTAGGLPRRERKSLRRDDDRGSLRPPGGESASSGTGGAGGDGGASFADDLSAFSAGASATGHDTTPPAGGHTDDEEEGR
ncbi:sensor histidine kinase [Streptomonospora alba]|uniref:sensor histidine kinase n=1 Tax=Streptomonospora alba TaxID=183763 RepID=UPI00069B5D08|nr:ATP-binding protein [Streptomonospora alba]